MRMGKAQNAFTHSPRRTTDEGLLQPDAGPVPCRIVILSPVLSSELLGFHLLYIDGSAGSGFCPSLALNGMRWGSEVLAVFWKVF